MKATAIAPANIAFIKYWGKKNDRLRLPLNSSLSVNLSGLSTTTTVEFLTYLSEDLIAINNSKNPKIIKRVIKHLDLIRKFTGNKSYAKVKSINNFTTASGLASSASGFAALTLAASKAAGLNLGEKELTILARQGSGSACRSIPDGWVEWTKGNSNNSSYAYSIFPKDYWDISVISAIISNQEKEVKSTEGMRFLSNHKFMRTRVKGIDTKIKEIKNFIALRKFTEFGELIEREALELHAMILTSNPPIIYWEPATIRLMKLVQKWRKDGLESYFTIDAGSQLKIVIENKNRQKIFKKLSSVKDIVDLVVNKPSQGAFFSDKHLF